MNRAPSSWSSVHLRKGTNSGSRTLLSQARQVLAHLRGHLIRLLLDRRLGPLFWAQFTGAVNDNLLKNAYVILIAYRETQSADATEIVVTLAAAIFILPYFLLSATAGELADKYAKSWLLQRVKLTEIGVAAIAAKAASVAARSPYS